MNINKKHHAFCLTPAQLYRFKQAQLLETQPRDSIVPGYSFNPSNMSAVQKQKQGKPAPSKKDTNQTQFKVGDRVKTASGKTGTVFSIAGTRTPLITLYLDNANQGYEDQPYWTASPNKLSLIGA